MISFLSLLSLLKLVTAEPTLPFQEQTIDDKVSIGYGIALGDVDGDGKTDILLADAKQIVWYRNGDWKKFVMAENITERDNVCIAARDLDGDGKVEVAVGAMWNPGETSDSTKSGSVHYLSRPQNAEDKWQVINLRHEPTVHRMKWVKNKGKNYLVVLPLHGRNNKGGEGEGVRIYAYAFPDNPKQEWTMTLLANDMHMTHNFAAVENNGGTELLVAGKEGVRRVSMNKMENASSTELKSMKTGAGEIKTGKNGFVTIEPMHGNGVVYYEGKNNSVRQVLDTTLHEGHAIGIADFLGKGSEQIVAGWRNPDKENNFGIRFYQKDDSGNWSSQWLDKNGMACEDLQVADLDNNGKADIVAAGRSTGNLKIYWNGK